MTIHIESTTKIVYLQIPGATAVPARVWEGVTHSGIPVHVFITRIGVKDSEDTSQFERELIECRPPSREVESIPLRLIL